MALQSFTLKRIMLPSRLADLPVLASQESPVIGNMKAEADADACSVNATFSLVNKPANAFWEWSKVCSQLAASKSSSTCLPLTGVQHTLQLLMLDGGKQAHCLTGIVSRCPQVPEVKVTAKAMLPSTSVVGFTLGVFSVLVLSCRLMLCC